ncbi:MAG: OmpA family protein, partial [Myxococcota bacterium]|nr:OmpA family protein [Myxococcota bacterium]
MKLRASIGLGLAVTMAAAGCGASAGPSSQMALRRVVLYENGLGYFERSGRVEEQSLPLRFGAHEVDDVLSTLTVLDADGGQTVVSASVPQRLPGESDDATVVLDLRLPDRRTRDLVLTYAIPTPAWRAAYRVVLPEERGEGEALFQVWALVHNSSPEDWNAVELSLATAAPISYAIDLRTPEFVSRPDATGHMVAPTVSGTVVAERSRGEGDGDGIPDADDLCPSEPEDRDGFQDSDGCPDPDNDSDRLADARDQCPNDPETYNGIEDEDGCPDRGHVIVEENSIAILDKIYFARGSSEIRAASTPIVDAVAATLNGNPYITEVEIGGHASDDDADAWSLAAGRAAAVRAALVQRGVDASR